MEYDGIQYVTAEDGSQTAVLVPIAKWRELTSEIESLQLMQSPELRQRIEEARGNTEWIPYENIKALVEEASTADVHEAA